MKKVTLEERRQCALRIHASYAFKTVVSFCKHILETPIEMTDPAYTALIVAIYTTYGRPFTNCWGFGKLTADLIPADQKELHDDLMNLRDKLYAHADKDIIHEDYGPMNDIRVSISPEGRFRVWTQPVQATPPQVKRILSLATTMHEKMEYWTNRFTGKYMKNITDTDFPPGEYLLDTESVTGLLIRRDAEQANRERLRISRAVSLSGKSEAPHS